MSPLTRRWTSAAKALLVAALLVAASASTATIAGTADLPPQAEALPQSEATPQAEAAPQPESPAPAKAPAAGRVRGAITGPDRKPLSGRLVTLRMIGGAGELRVTTTDERGQYQFRELPPGKYEVRVEAEGFEPGVKSGIEVKAPFQNVVDIPMRSLGALAPAGSGTLATLAAAARAAAAQALQPSSPHPAAPGTAADAPSPAPPEPVPLTGLLRDKDGTPILEATVLALPASGGPLHQGRSDKEGKFRVEAVPPGFYRLLVRSPGHVPIDLARIEVPPQTGLALRLVLVDYPINFKAGPDTTLPPEKPRPWPPASQAPAASPAPPATVQPAPEPEEGPQTPPNPEPAPER